MTGNGTSTVVFSGTIVNLNAALNGLIYTPTNGFTGSDSLQVNINDEGNTGIGGPQTADASVSLSVTAPTVRTAGGTSLAYTQQNPAAVIDAGVCRSSALAVRSPGRRSRSPATSPAHRTC